MRDPRVVRALELHDEGQGSVAIGNEIGVDRHTVEAWLRTFLFDHCTICETKLRRSTSDGVCGLCEYEAAEKAEAIA